nr:hypothetical protein [Angustibacter aerolatus]
MSHNVPDSVARIVEAAIIVTAVFVQRRLEERVMSSPSSTSSQGVVTTPADDPGVRAAADRRRSLTSIVSRNGAVAVLLLVVVLGVVTVPSFGSADNLRNVALAASFIGIIAAGMTFVIISGGIDLSVGSTYALAVILSASAARYGSWAAIGAGLGAAALVGLVQGVVISWLRLPPFIVTLAGLTGVRGLVFLITHEGNDHPQIEGFRVFEVLGTGRLATIGTPVWIMLVCFAIGWWVLNRTPFGQSLQAIGGNRPAAEPMGLPVRRNTVTVYVVSALAAGLAGLLTTAVSGGGQEARIGDSYEPAGHRGRGHRRHAAQRRRRVDDRLAGRRQPAVRHPEPDRAGRQPQLVRAAGGVGRVPARGRHPAGHAEPPVGGRGAVRTRPQTGGPGPHPRAALDSAPTARRASSQGATMRRQDADAPGATQPGRPPCRTSRCSPASRTRRSRGCSTSTPTSRGPPARRCSRPSRPSATGATCRRGPWPPAGRTSSA